MRSDIMKETQLKVKLQLLGVLPHLFGRAQLIVKPVSVTVTLGLRKSPTTILDRGRAFSPYHARHAREGPKTP